MEFHNDVNQICLPKFGKTFVCKTDLRIPSYHMSHYKIYRAFLDFVSLCCKALQIFCQSTKYVPMTVADCTSHFKIKYRDSTICFLVGGVEGIVTRPNLFLDS